MIKSFSYYLLTQLESPAPLPSAPPPHGDSEPFAERTFDHFSNAYRRKEVLAQKKDNKRYNKDERHCEGDARAERVGGTQAIAANASSDGGRGKATDAEEGCQDEDGAVYRHFLQFLNEGDVR